jgi:hypothetical protein
MSGKEQAKTARGAYGEIGPEARADRTAVIRALVSAAVGIGLVAAVVLWLNGCGTETHTLNSAAGSGSGAGGEGAGSGGGGTGGAAGSLSGGTGGSLVAGSGGQSQGGAGGESGDSGSGGSGGSGGDTQSDVCPPNIEIPALCRLCADGSCGRPVCKDGEFTGKWACPEDTPTAVDCDCALGAYVPVCGVDGQTYDAACGRECVPVSIACDGECPCTDCIVGGCSGELCVEASAGQPPVSTCEWLPEYACYQTATCERQANGNCGWTSTPELTRCLSDAAGGNGALHWYLTCGDPVCGISPDPWDDPAVRNCTNEQVGDPCTSEGELCDGVASCGASLICAASDPTMGPGGCPISRARFKEDISYLGEQELREYHQQLMSMPLASYRYRYAPGAGPQLGFIIEDIEPSVAVSGDHVNLYGYLSMAVAAIKVQQAEIASLRGEIDRLRARLAQAPEELVCAP